MESQEFYIRTFAGLPVEGVGLTGNGSYFLWGQISVMDSGLIHVSMKGWSAAVEMARRHAGTFAWWGSAAVLRNGIAAPVIPMRLNARGPELWSNETRLGLRYRPIGACTIKIPDNCRRDEYSVRIQGGYTYNGVPPAPPSARLDVPVPIPQSEAV